MLAAALDDETYENSLGPRISVRIPSLWIVVDKAPYIEGKAWKANKSAFLIFLFTELLQNRAT